MTVKHSVLVFLHETKRTTNKEPQLLRFNPETYEELRLEIAPYLIPDPAVHGRSFEGIPIEIDPTVPLSLGFIGDM